MHTESVRQKAIRYINEIQSEHINKFQPYQNERNNIGGLLCQNQKSQFQQNNRIKIKHFQSLAQIVKQKPQIVIQSSNSNHKKDSKFDLSLICNLEKPTIEEQQKAKQYKDMMEKKALLEMFERKKNSNNVSPQLEVMMDKLHSDVSNDKFIWKMNNIDKGKNLGYLFHESKIRKHSKKLLKIEPTLPDYEPKYEAILPKSISVLIKPSDKPSYSQQIQEYIRKNQLDKEPLKLRETPQKQENSLEKMYGIIQNQITKEVNQSLISNPQSMNPLEEFSVKPIEDTYLQQFHQQVKQKMKETNRARKNIQNKIKEFDSYLQKGNIEN